MTNLMPLGDLAEFINGRAFKPEEWSNKGTPIIRIQNLTGSSQVVNYFDGAYEEKYKVNRGDILISWSASLGVYIWGGNNAVLNQHIFKVLLRDFVDKMYFYYAAHNALEEMTARIHGATMQHITKDQFDSIQVAVPPLSEQKRLAALLDRADRLRRARRYARHLSDTFLQAVFLEMFGDPVTNPMGWDVCLLEELGDLDRGRSRHRPRDAPQLLGGPYPLIQTGEVANSNGYITAYKQTYSETGLKQSKMWPKGTLCITIAANIAKTGILTFDACFPDSVVGFTANLKTNTEYIQQWFSFVQQYLERTAPESAQKNINLEILRGLRVPLPPVQQQKRFINVVQKFERLRAQQAEAERQAEHLYQTLLHRAFRGELSGGAESGAGCGEVCGEVCGD